MTQLDWNSGVRCIGTRRRDEAGETNYCRTVGARRGHVVFITCLWRTQHLEYCDGALIVRSEAHTSQLETIQMKKLIIYYNTNQ